MGKYKSLLKAVIAGATGLVGTHLVKNLLKDKATESIVVVGRRKFDSDDSRIENLYSEFSDLSSINFPQNYNWFCCLGTTIKKAGSKQRFIEVDKDMVVGFASQAMRCNAQSFHLVSAAGASQKSPFFYSRVKGETEAKVISLGLQATYIYRPSFILGNRSEYRLGEEIGKTLIKAATPFLQGSFRRYRGIHAEDIALGMIRSANKTVSGVHVLDSEEILKIR